jgi:hypothetical protein
VGLVVGLSGAGAVVGAALVPAVAPSCDVSVAHLDAELGIDAAHVTALHPGKPAGALICSYYGNSGRAANEATLNYVPASPTTFAGVKLGLRTVHKIRTLAGIDSGAYSYSVGSERYLYVLVGPDQVQLFATVPLVRLEALARTLPLRP